MLTGVASGVVIVVASFESTACCSPPLEKLMRVGRLLAMVDEFDYVLCVYVFMVACDVPCSGGVVWEASGLLYDREGGKSPSGQKRTGFYSDTR